VIGKVTDIVNLFPDTFDEAIICIGANVFINIGCIVEHDCIIENIVFLSLGVIFSGSVKVKQNSFVGSGAIISTGL